MKKLAFLLALAMIAGAVCIPVAADGYSAEDLYASADLYVNFEDGFVDLTGNHEIIPHNDPEIIDSVYGKGVNCNAEDNTYVAIEGVDFGTESFSVSFWLRVNDTYGDGMFIGNKDYHDYDKHAGWQPGWSFSFRDSNMKLSYMPSYSNDTEKSQYRQDCSFTFDTYGNYEYWVHVVFVMDVEAGKRTMYINNAPVSCNKENFTLPEGSTINSTSEIQYLMLGDGISGNSNNQEKRDPYMNVDFDDVAVFKRVLTQEEVTVLYNYESASNEPPETEPPETDPPETDPPESNPGSDTGDTDTGDTDTGDTDTGDTDTGDTDTGDTDTDAPGTDNSGEGGDGEGENPRFPTVETIVGFIAVMAAFCTGIVLSRLKRKQ
ncbi:MAG: LamG domain-containing protein [Clostridia bacterium]|nr:LamG domain-containing protein [Clostridia bacterium]